MEHARALLTLAEVQKSLGQHEPSLATLARAGPMLDRLGRDASDERMTLRLSVADNLLDLGRYEEGRKALQAELPALAASRGAESFDVALTRVRIATSMASQGLHEEARAALRELEPLLEKDWRTEGMGAATLRADVGYTQWQLRLFPEAIRSLERAVGELDHLAGPHNTSSVQAGRTLGMAYLDSGNYRRADEVFAGNVERSRHVYGPEDSETALNLSFEVMALNRLGRADAAEVAARESVRIAQKTGSTLSASVARGFTRRLGSALLVNGKPAEALRWLDDLVAQEVAAGQKDTRHAASLMLRAAALTASGRPREGAEAAQASQQIWREAGAPLGAVGQIGLARAQLNEALAWLAAGEPAKAEAPIASAERLLREHYASPHPEQPLAALVRAQWLRASGRVEEADAVERAARARYRELAGTDAPRPVAVVL
jgi:tetratricopeptide (TPR) repeat protein